MGGCEAPQGIPFGALVDTRRPSANCSVAWPASLSSAHRQADSWQQQQLQQQQKLQLQQQQQQQQQGLQFGGLAQVSVRSCCSHRCYCACRQLIVPSRAQSTHLHTVHRRAHLSQPSLQATEGVDDEDASSRASSPAKSPLFGGGQGSPFLDQQDQPLARHPQGARAGARLSQQGLGGGLGGLGSGRPTPLQVPGGFDAAAAAAAGGHQQTLQRPPSPLSRPGLPAWGASATEEGLPPVPRSPGLGGRAGTPTGRLFGGGAAGGLFGAAAPSDPMTYQMQAQLDGDGVPNMGDVQGLGGGAAPAPRMHMRQQSAAAAAAAAQQQQQQQQQWNIPALHTTPGSASRPRVGTPGAGGTMSAGGKRGLPDKKPGAAFKLGKRNAYLKYLAYEVGGWAGVASYGGLT